MVFTCYRGLPAFVLLALLQLLHLLQQLQQLQETAHVRGGVEAALGLGIGTQVFSPGLEIVVIA